MSEEERPSKFRKFGHERSTESDEHHVENNPTVQSHQQAEAVTEQLNEDSNLYSDVKSNPQTNNGHLEDVQRPLSAAATPIATMSKNQMKKLRKKQEWEAGRESRKVKRKEKNKEKKERKREQRAHGGVRTSSTGQNAASGSKPWSHKSVQLPVTFIIDCGFDDKMLEKEMISLGSQLTRAYSDNSRSLYQAHLVVSSWGGQLKHRFDTVLDKHYLNWREIKFTDSDFVEAAAEAKHKMSSDRSGRMDGVFRKYATNTSKEKSRDVANGGDTEENSVSIDLSPTALPGDGNPASNHDDTNKQQPLPLQSANTNTNLNPESNPNPEPLPPAETIYLTSDSPHTLTDLNPHSTYIIGGLVDKNRHKGLCYKTACDRGIKTAKLPIGEYMEMQSRFVLATNHVVQIMLRWLEVGDWGEAFMQVIPKRKGGKLRSRKRVGADAHAEDVQVELEVEVEVETDEDGDDDEDENVEEVGNQGEDADGRESADGEERSHELEETDQQGNTSESVHVDGSGEKQETA